MGSVWSGDRKSSYGFYFRPPYELHSWLDFGLGRILDFGLPGVIEAGLNTCDEQGPCIVGREPVILAGEPFDWMEYKAYGYVQLEKRGL